MVLVVEVWENLGGWNLHLRSWIQYSRGSSDHSNFGDVEVGENLQSCSLDHDGYNKLSWIQIIPKVTATMMRSSDQSTIERCELETEVKSSHDPMFPRASKS